MIRIASDPAHEPPRTGSRTPATCVSGVVHGTPLTDSHGSKGRRVLPERICCQCRVIQGMTTSIPDYDYYDLPNLSLCYRCLGSRSSKQGGEYGEKYGGEHGGKYGGEGATPTRECHSSPPPLISSAGLSQTPSASTGTTRRHRYGSRLRLFAAPPCHVTQADTLPASGQGIIKPS